jgi:hypothetical protein
MGEEKKSMQEKIEEMWCKKIEERW